MTMHEPIDQSYNLGDRVEVRVHGFGYGNHPRWVEAVIIQLTAKRVRVQFRTAAGVVLHRSFGGYNVRRMTGCNTVEQP